VEGDAAVAAEQAQGPPAQLYDDHSHARAPEVQPRDVDSASAAQPEVDFALAAARTAAHDHAQPSLAQASDAEHADVADGAAVGACGEGVVGEEVGCAATFDGPAVGGRASERDARGLLGQVMGYVAATVGFAALGAYLGRDLSGAAGLLSSSAHSQPSSGSTSRPPGVASSSRSGCCSGSASCSASRPPRS
jgi:hypothetical protein